MRCLAGTAQVFLYWIAIRTSIASGSHAWSYTEPSTSPAHWAKSTPTCGGTLQSPINIQDTTYHSQLAPVKLILKTGVELHALVYQVANNGHSAMISFPSETWFVSFIDSTTKQYEVVQLHFHWGTNDQRGSEHYIGGHQYSLEAHMVMFNRMYYENISVAAASPDGLAVLGFLNQVVTGTKAEDTFIGSLGNFDSALASVLFPRNLTTIAAFDLRAVMKLVDPAKYYRYPGSLTTVPCTQNVIWTVFQKTIPAKMEQLQKLRNLNFPSTERQTKMSDNFRLLQPVNQAHSLLPRTVYRSWNAGCSKKPFYGVILMVSLFSIYLEQFS